MKFIDDIEIKNFKSIRHQKVEACKRINLFVGPPNTGKSNMLEAIGLYGINDSKLNFKSFVRIESSSTLFNGGNVNRSIEVNINKLHLALRLVENDVLSYFLKYHEVKEKGIHHHSGREKTVQT